MFQAEMKYKFRYTTPRSCVIEKVVQLAEWEFDAFSADMLKHWDFIRDNREHMFSELRGVAHCLLVTGDGHKDGVLVNSEGYNYARYACHIPDAQALLTASRYPSLTTLNEKLSAFVEYLANEYLPQIEKGDRVELPIFDEAEAYGVDISGSDILRETVIDMLGERLAEHDLDMELDKDELILTPREQDMQMGM
jgi:hypothetical protein